LQHPNPIKLKKKKKKRSAWDKLNDWLTRYKAILGAAALIIALAGLYGIWISFKGQQLTEQQYINSLKPNWQVEMEYLPNNVDLVKVDFKSLNPNITLQKLLFYRLNYEGELLVTEYYSNSWKVQNFSNDLIDYTYVDSPVNNAFETAFETGEVFNWDSCYPVAFQFNYLINGEVNIVTSLYKVHFRLIKKNRLKIIGLEFMENIPNDSRNYMKTSLVDLNTRNCAAKEHYEVTMLIDSIKKIIPYYQHVDSLIHLGHHTTKLLFPDKGLSYRVPKIVSDGKFNERFNQTLEASLESKGTYDTIIYRALQEIRLLLKQNPICDNFDESCIIQTTWIEEDTFYAWHYLILALDVQLQNACEREKRRLVQEKKPLKMPAL